jgi:hypothetical protein
MAGKFPARSARLFIHGRPGDPLGRLLAAAAGFFTLFDMPGLPALLGTIRAFISTGHDDSPIK